MSKEIDYRFRYLYKQVNRCPKCRGLLEYCGQAASLPPNIHCTACGWRDWDMKGCRIDHDLLGSMARGLT